MEDLLRCADKGMYAVKLKWPRNNVLTHPNDAQAVRNYMNHGGLIH